MTGVLISPMCLDNFPRADYQCRQDGHFCHQILLKQSSWFNLQ